MTNKVNTSQHETTTNSTYEITKILRQVIAEPQKYDGERSKFEQWWTSILLWNKGHSNLPDDALIIAVLSYITEGEALHWAQIQQKEVLDEKLTSWEEFSRRIKERFEDPTIKEKAMHEIHEFSSKKKSIQEYIDRFTILKEKSSIDDEEAYYLFQKGLPPHVIRDLLSNNTTPPNTYETLKNWVNQYAQNQEIRRGILGALSESVTSRDQRTYTGITYGGRGQTMEIDAIQQKGCMRCFNCGKTGHLKAECKGPKRRPGECYECGSKEHLVAKCPKKRNCPTIGAQTGDWRERPTFKVKQLKHRKEEEDKQQDEIAEDIMEEDQDFQNGDD